MKDPTATTHLSPRSSGLNSFPEWNTTTPTRSPQMWSVLLCLLYPMMLGELLLTLTTSRRQILDYRKKVRGYTSVAITSAATTPIPTTLCATGRRFLLSDVYTSRDKRIIIYILHDRFFLSWAQYPWQDNYCLHCWDNYGSSEASSKESASLLPTAFFRTNTTLPTAVAFKTFAPLPVISNPH